MSGVRRSLGMWIVSAAVVGTATGCAGSCGEKSDSGPAKNEGTGMAPMQSSDTAGTFRGVLHTGMMGIGGEHTGIELWLDNGARIEVEPGSERAAAEGLDGKRVVITGEVEAKAYVERGNVKVLKVATIEADQATK